MANPDIVGRHVRQLRLARKLTQMDLAELSGITQSTLSEIERGTRQGGGLTLRAARRLAFALGVSLDALAGTPADDEDEEHTKPTGERPRPEPAMKAPATVPPFDATRYMLGPLCPSGHDFDGAGHSLRLRGRTGAPGACVTCTEARHRATSQRRRTDYSSSG